ncbi:clp protease adapter protein ClpF, chloroplastic isoform X1 [Phragmites australis]|uniref:clp protease adapter protein ClpF, chloroplastic isoform X1 n=1 Tax=Phragmites australis TaxID=29695 RepID=UPI002D7A1A36|nr:clp protease adapter protein ClpF, chloroplastic isoform X1 [Phragmites australis]XP_062206969.1 clp protease adapter protein ClpF, chloroplastic isoform X1 [Phragmites australis]
MQAISICGSVASTHGANCRAAFLAKNDLAPPCEVNSVSHGAHSWRWHAHKLHMRTDSRRMNTTIRTNARWLFGGDGRSSDARLERSEAANEDILIFYFQLDLQTRIQYALNIEQFDVAKQMREKLTEIETEIIRQREAKRGSSKTEAQDKALNLLRVRADLQKAINSENYALAAGLRDEIAKLETESLAVSAKALAYQNVKYVFRLGQKVRHKVHGYRAVICGMDPVCCESKSWMETANVEKLSKGPNQPFYQVLVDVYVDPELLVAYVAEENLSAAEESEKGRFDHPYIEFLFFGEDTAGDFIPIKQLREKYDQPRYEASGDENDDDGNTDS